jgi:hypothetical protein
MSGGKVGKTDTNPPGVGAIWPVWAKAAVSAAVVVQAAAALTAALAWPPSSALETWVADRFAVYYQVLDQGYSYHYYAPEPGPTPVIKAAVHYDDGRKEREVRIPSRGLTPRLRYQRQLALATHLTEQYTGAKAMTGDGAENPVVRAFARHLAREHPGCASVTVSLQWHLIPNLLSVRQALAEGRRIDLDDEEYYTAPERIGDFPCDGL